MTAARERDSDIATNVELTGYVLSFYGSRRIAIAFVARTACVSADAEIARIKRRRTIAAVLAARQVGHC